MRRETMTNVGMLQPGTSEYEAFLSRDQRIVYARYKDRRADIFLLEQGQAEAQREFTRANLECMMPDCSDRRLTTVSRSHSGRRDGFRHFAKGHGNHSPESLNHQQAKLAVASWITRRHSGLLVQLEELVGARDRVADVLVTSVTSGKRMAIEIQYSEMSIAQWRERHESYANMDVADLWLLGHTTLSTDAHGKVELTSLHRAMLKAGSRLLWINPITEEIGVVWADLARRACPRRTCFHGERDQYWALPSGADDDGWVQLVRLDDCLLRWGDIETPSPLGSAESVKQWELLCDRAHERELRLGETRLSRQAAAYRRPITPATKEPAVPARDAVLCGRCGGVLKDREVQVWGVHADPKCHLRW
ncbi:hypothetical protein H5399_16540 [Tessaracoccus sp. MC1627]|uniref:competence protein CoiA family protein n=1 Tax=Tessaracoccus sp. MC1627 TaxID=2760312 RepID=UPI001602C780|nr:hypothetical protein [Tessaracoccus sp. MC1627]